MVDQAVRWNLAACRRGLRLVSAVGRRAFNSSCPGGTGLKGRGSRRQTLHLCKRLGRLVVTKAMNGRGVKILGTRPPRSLRPGRRASCRIFRPPCWPPNIEHRARARQAKKQCANKDAATAHWHWFEAQQREGRCGVKGKGSAEPGERASRLEGGQLNEAACKRKSRLAFAPA